MMVPPQAAWRLEWQTWHMATATGEKIPPGVVNDYHYRYYINDVPCVWREADAMICLKD
jgi:hypothetical protein